MKFLLIILTLISFVVSSITKNNFISLTFRITMVIFFIILIVCLDFTFWYCLIILLLGSLIVFISSKSIK